MKPYINRNAINKTQFLSAGVSVLSYIVHQLRNEGVYTGKIYKKSELVDKFTVNCSEKYNLKQVDVNLSEFKSLPLSKKGQKTFEISKKGYLLLYDSKFDNDYHIRLDKALKRKREKKEFDTKILEEGDFYVITLLRPGEYQGYNLKNKSEFQVKVLYPDSKQRSKNSGVIPPVNVEVTDEGFHPKTVKITPGQGLTFNIKTQSNIEINLKKGFEKKQKFDEELSRDKKSKEMKRRFHWVNPKKRKGKK